MSSIDANDPRRCQALTQKGQCAYQAAEGQEFCPYHLRDRDFENKQSLKAYQLTNIDIAESAGRHSQVEELKSLREEIALCRSLVERRLNMVESNADVISAVGQVNSLFVTLEKLVSSCHRLETSLGNLLSKASLLDLAKVIVEIVMDELEGLDGYETIVDRISERMVAKIAAYDPDEGK